MAAKNRILTAMGLAAGGVAGAAGLRQLLLRRPVPPRHESLAVRGVGGPVEIHIDRWGVAHVYAATAGDAIFAPPFNNKTKDILQIADDVLAAKIALASKDTNAAIARYRHAVAVQDQLNYGEPPDWYFQCVSPWAARS
jgi:acyl-homoserine lactone acylase PvdQ